MADFEKDSSDRTGSRGEFRTYHITKDKSGRKVTKEILEPFGKINIDRDSDSAFALVIRRDYVDEGSMTASSTTLQVNSPFILRAIQDVVKSYPTVPFDFNSPFVLSSPFQMLMHYWDELDIYRQDTTDIVMRRDMNMLFDFMKHEMGPARDQLKSMLRNEQITYPTAWVIYCPGDLLYTTYLEYGWLLRCVKTVYEESTTTGPYLQVHCTYTDHDGTSPCEKRHIVTIYQKQDFGQENSAIITDLPIYPRKFVKGQSGLEEQLEKRGRNFLSSQGIEVRAYDGLAEYLKDPPSSYWDDRMASFGKVWLSYTESGRVVLDNKTYQEDHYNGKGETKLTNPDPLLCPPFVMGYSISKKVWSRLLLENLNKVQWRSDAWDSLILDDEYKSMVRALVSSHEYPANARDVPDQKGKGLVILLHGAPGSGKTLTAESSAEETRRALLSASIGDLNKENIPWRFEHELKTMLQYATQWNAIVLLDEADVFLEARHEEAGDTSRNALVAVFLRQLEYFGGIIFLTTNRLKSFDRAMKSRIHLALEYKRPGIDVRRQIWMQCLEAVPADTRGWDDLDDLAETLAMTKLNGREIVYIINTSLTLARFKKSRLDASQIERVLSLKTAFEKKIERDAKALRQQAENVDWKQGPREILRQNSVLEEPEEDPK